MLGGITTTQAYTGFGEVSQFRAARGGVNLFHTTYIRDALGRIVEKTETIGARTDTYAYTYDPAGRLWQVRKNGVLQSEYRYDGNGNRLAKTTPAGTVAGQYDAQDRLLSYGASSYTYSAHGDLSSRTQAGQTTRYTYDALGNLRQVNLPGGSVIEYLIDGRNRRIGKRVNGALVQGFLYQDQLKLIAELDGAGNVVSRFVYATGINVPEYLVKGGQTYRLISDHLGSPRLVVNITTGAVVQRMDFDEYGNVLLDSNPGFQPFGFAGGLYDRDTKLVRFGARDYDPETGRWTAKDPIRFGGGDTNLYAYAFNDPVNLRDPTGLWSITAGGYLGWGVEVLFGRDANTGGGFLTVRVGYGLGGGISWQLGGTRPGSRPNECNTGGSGVGGFGDLGFNLGPLQAGIQSNAGVNFNNSGGPSPYGQLFNPSWGFGDSWGIRAGGAIGVEGTVYSAAIPR